MNNNRTVFLRAFEPDDYLLINKWRNDSGIQKLTGGTFRYVSLEREKTWVHNKMMNDSKDMYFAICLNDSSKKMIGYSSLNNIDYIHKTTSGAGTVIGEKEYQDGNAYIDALLELFDYAFNELNLNRIQCECLCEHNAAYRLLLSFGFILEGTLRQVIYKHGRYHNQYILSLLKEEYDGILVNDGYTMTNILKRLRKTKNNV